MTIYPSPAPTGDLDPATVARFRRRDTWLDFDRHQAGLPELVDCDGPCDDGIVQRVVVDYADDTGVSYAPAGGCSVSRTDDEWFCPACTALNAAEAA